MRDGQVAHGLPLVPAADQGGPGQAAGSDPGSSGFSDGIYGRSKGGMTPSGWSCEHLPYLVEIDNWGASRHPGQAKQGGIWVWGYDEITWFAHQSRGVSRRLAAVRLGLGAEDGPERPSPDARQPHDEVAAGRQALVLRQHSRARRSRTGSATRSRSVPSGRQT